MTQEFENGLFPIEKKESNYSRFNPFNHGTTSVNFQEVELEKFGYLSIILRNGWGIIEIDSIAQVSEGAEKSSNNFRVALGNKNYLLKESHINDPQTQKLVNDFITLLAENGMPVASIILTNSGESFYSQARAFCLYDFIDGERFDGSQKELKEVAKKLAWFHKFTLENPLIDQVKLKGTLIGHDWQLLESLIPLVKLRAGNSEFEKKVADSIDLVLEISNTVRIANLDQLPFQVIHRDVHPHNLLFDKSFHDLLAFLDFDPIVYSQRLRDLVFAMHRLSRTFGEQTERKNDLGIDIRVRAREFLKSYLEVNPLTDLELSKIVAMIRDEELKRFIDTINGYYLKNDRTWDFDLEKHLTCLQEAELFDFS
ncbi:MAG TPA: phosphotransferase [Patescibacteria group bacterium]